MPVRTVLALLIASVIFCGPIASAACPPDSVLPEGVIYVELATPCPVAMDSIVVAVYGGLPNSCWSPLVLDSAKTEESLIRIDCSTVHSGSDICLGNPLFFYHEVQAGVLAEGSYDVEVVTTIDTGKYAGTYLCTSEIHVVAKGDVNTDLTISSADIILLVDYVFKGGDVACGPKSDVNCDGVVTSGDILYLVRYVFKAGPPPIPDCSSS